MYRKTTFVILTSAVATVALAAPAQAGVSGPAFWIDGQLYRTVATPTDLSGTGAPDSTFDAIYSFDGAQRNVAEAKPGDRDFNGGRWAVYPVTWAAGVTPMQATNDGQVLAWAQAGLLTVASQPVRLFECTVNPVPPSWD